MSKEEQKQKHSVATPPVDPSGGPTAGKILKVGEVVILEPLPPRDPPPNPLGNF